jgi:hypothetical protein
MKIKIPKTLVGVLFPRVLTIELNDFNIDLFLPTLFFKILGSGRPRGRRSNDPTRIAAYVDALAEHPMLEGFRDPEGRRLLERLVRTSLIVTGRVGEGGKRGEQILSITPYTLLTHKPGFPAESRRQRSVDNFLYHALRTKLGSDEALRDYMKRFFGKGVTIHPLPYLGGEYDGVTELDILTRLSIAFLDVFDSTGTASSERRGPDRNVPSPCPAQVDELATDLLRYMFAYCEQMPNQALTYYLMGLINFELFVFTLKLIHSINALVANPDELPAAMHEEFAPSPPELYLDFTARPGGLSQQMAIACVRRDIEAYQQYVTSILTLRQLDKYVESLRRNARRKAEIDEALGGRSSGPLYIQGLLQLQQHPRISIDIEASARIDEDKIRAENGADEDDPDGDSLDALDQIVGPAESDLERAVLLLAEGQRSQVLSSSIRWFIGVGGLSKSHGILKGTQKNRRSWRYEPSNDLLALLVQLAAARLAPPNQQNDGGVILPEIPLQEFLAFLEQRFGILIDRPPSQFSGAEYAAAARENLRAMLARLRQMGMFNDLSDDFTVQRLRPPYAAQNSHSEAPR